MNDVTVLPFSLREGKAKGRGEGREGKRKGQGKVRERGKGRRRRGKGKRKMGKREGQGDEEVINKKGRAVATILLIRRPFD